MGADPRMAREQAALERLLKHATKADLVAYVWRQMTPWHGAVREAFGHVYHVVQQRRLSEMEARFLADRAELEAARESERLGAVVEAIDRQDAAEERRRREDARLHRLFDAVYGRHEEVEEP